MCITKYRLNAISATYKTLNLCEIFFIRLVNVLQDFTDFGCIVEAFAPRIDVTIEICIVCLQLHLSVDLFSVCLNQDQSRLKDKEIKLLNVIRPLPKSLLPSFWTTQSRATWQTDEFQLHQPLNTCCTFHLRMHNLQSICKLGAS